MAKKKAPKKVKTAKAKPVTPKKVNNVVFPVAENEGGGIVLK